jgi:hypothetical protein
MQMTHAPKLADFLKSGKPTTCLNPITSICHAKVKDHIVVDRGFTAVSIYLLVPSAGETFMVMRKGKNEFIDTNGNEYSFIKSPAPYRMEVVK